MKADDPLHSVYAEYVEELKARWDGKTEISSTDAISAIGNIEKVYESVEIPAYEVNCDKYMRLQGLFYNQRQRVCSQHAFFRRG